MVEDKNIYWNIYATLMISIFGVMHIIATAKRWIEKMKEYQNHQIINIQINPEPAAGQQEGAPPIIQQQFNNQKHNNPFFNDKQVYIIAVVTFVGVGATLFFHLYLDLDQCEVLNTAAKEFLYRVLLLEPIFCKVIIPIMYLMQRKDARNFFWMTLKDILC